VKSQTPSAPTYGIHTLGCKANQYDSQRIAEALEALGYRMAGPLDVPGLIIINTCTVTGTADRKSRQLVRRAVRRHPEARVFVTGCCATLSGGTMGSIEGVSGAYGRLDRATMIEAIAGGGPVPPAARLEGDFGISAFRGRSRAFVKIQDGCNSSCTYCIVPRARGRSRSRPLQDVVREAQRLTDAGLAELVLTGIHLGSYGRDLGRDVDLARAVRAVAAVPGVGRVRLSSIEPLELTDPLLDAMAECPQVCPHLHLPLQSGDDGVLRRMGRPYTARQFLQAVGRARERLDRPAVTGDVIVGFPGETESEFENTVGACREAGFSRMHVFPFSPRPGTPAAAMHGQVPGAVVKGRLARLEELAEEMACAWAQGFVGREVRVLFERKGPGGLLEGYTERYVHLRAPGPDALAGRIVRVRCVRAEGRGLVGEEGASAISDC